MDKYKGVNTPCDKFIESNADNSKLYRSAVGSLVYAMMATRPACVGVYINCHNIEEIPLKHIGYLCREYLDIIIL